MLFFFAHSLSITFNFTRSPRGNQLSDIICEWLKVPNAILPQISSSPCHVNKINLLGIITYHSCCCCCWRRSITYCIDWSSFQSRSTWATYRISASTMIDPQNKHVQPDVPMKSNRKGGHINGPRRRSWASCWSISSLEPNPNILFDKHTHYCIVINCLVEVISIISLYLVAFPTDGPSISTGHQ